MNTATDTSTLAEQVAKPSRSQQMVLDVLIAAQKNRLPQPTAGDIRESLERIHAPRRFDKGWVTARLDELHDKGVVEQSEDRRLNPVTGKRSHTWFIPAQQSRLCA